MTVLVVGAGFIGAPTVKRLVDRDERVVCLDHDPEADPGIDGVEFVVADITDRPAIERVIERVEPTRVVHLAYVMAAEMERQPTRAIEVNCLGVDNVFGVAAEAGVERVVFTSSIAVYGRPDNYAGSVAEDATVPAAFTEFPTYLYTATKQLNEYQARNYARGSDLDTACVRPNTVFGPGRTSGATKWASTFVSDPARGEPGHVPLPPDQRVGLVYREDVADLLATVALADTVAHDAYNTGGHVVTAREVADLVEGIFGQPVSCDPDADPQPLVADVSNERARREFDYALTPLAEALRAHGAAV